MTEIYYVFYVSFINKSDLIILYGTSFLIFF